MTLNLGNPITEDLKPEMLSGETSDCYISRTGYEVMMNGEKYALYPQFSETDANIGDEVIVDSMGLMRRGQVVKVLTGYQEAYTEQQIIGETDAHYLVHERNYRKDRGFNEHDFKITKHNPNR